MKFSIIIPCYNEAKNLPSLIEALQQVPQKGYDVEFILVENGSVDNSRQVFGALPQIDQIFIKSVYVDVNQGYGYGLIQGWQAATGDYIGWIHADMQISPEQLVIFFDYAARYTGVQPLFIKGSRTNRSPLDRFFTAGMTWFETFLFGYYLHDIGAMPVLFDTRLLSQMDKPSFDFSLDLYCYVTAKAHNYKVVRLKVTQKEREEGNSSWNTGLKSRFKQSKIIMQASLKIKKGEQVK